MHPPVKRGDNSRKVSETANEMDILSDFVKYSSSSLWLLLFVSFWFLSDTNWENSLHLIIIFSQIWGNISKLLCKVLDLYQYVADHWIWLCAVIISKFTPWLCDTSGSVSDVENLMLYLPFINLNHSICQSEFFSYFQATFNHQSITRSTPIISNRSAIFQQLNI